MNNDDKEKDQIQFHYIKSNDFRVVLVEGAIGSITPAGRIVVSLYNERVALPKKQAFDIRDDGTLNLSSVDGRAGFVRELEVALSLDLTTAENIRDWLEEQVEILKSIKDSTVE